MIFQVDWNHETDDKTLKLIGAKLHIDDDAMISYYTIELEDFDDLQDLLEKVHIIKNEWYSAIISHDPMTIYLDNRA